MSDEDAIEGAALRLPRAERARLAERLIASLGPDPEAEAKWRTEVCRRVEELRSGTVACMPGEQVFREMDEMLR